MAEPRAAAIRTGMGTGKRRFPVVNYSLRPAKNIERKMMAEAFARLAPLSPLSKYRYVGFGSEFFNDFALYHEALGILDMVSIEHDLDRIERCEFNRPYKCIRVEAGTASEVLPKLKWEPRSIVWLDYLSKLERSVLADINLVASAASSGSLLIWTVNAHPWGEGWDEDEGRQIPTKELPVYRVRKLRDSIAPRPIPDEWIREPLSKWGLAGVYYRFIVAEIASALGDRNASAKASDKLEFRQLFHFRYADTTRMLTVGGLLLNPADAKTIGDDPFAGLSFARGSAEALELRPPVLTGREVRHLSRLLPHDDAKTEPPGWLASDDLERFRELYRYYPIFAESEL